MSATQSFPAYHPLFRGALFAAAVSLAFYIPYKYGTQLHANEGLYAFLFPLSALLAAAGIVFAVKPGKSCDCGVPMRTGLGALSILWLATGLACVGSLTTSIIADPLRGGFATFHMFVQHVFLSLAVLAFVVAPQRMAGVRGLATAPSNRVPGSAAAS